MYEHGGYKLEYGCQFVEFDDNWRHRGSGDAWGWVRDVGICSRGRRMRKRSEGEELTECPLRKLNKPHYCKWCKFEIVCFPRVLDRRSLFANIMARGPRLATLLQLSSSSATLEVIILSAR